MICPPFENLAFEPFNVDLHPVNIALANLVEKIGQREAWDVDLLDREALAAMTLCDCRVCSGQTGFRNFIKRQYAGLGGECSLQDRFVAALSS